MEELVFGFRLGYAWNIELSNKKAAQIGNPWTSARCEAAGAGDSSRKRVLCWIPNFFVGQEKCKNIKAVYISYVVYTVSCVRWKDIDLITTWSSWFSAFRSVQSDPWDIIPARTASRYEQGLLSLPLSCMEHNRKRCWYMSQRELIASPYLRERAPPLKPCIGILPLIRGSCGAPEGVPVLSTTRAKIVRPWVGRVASIMIWNAVGR